MKQLKEKQEQRDEVAAKVSKMTDVYADGQKVMTDEDMVAFDSYQSDIERLDKEIETLRRVEIAKSLSSRRTNALVQHAEPVVRASQAACSDEDLAVRAWALSQGQGAGGVTQQMITASQRAGFNLTDKNLYLFDQSALGTATEGGNALSGNQFQQVVETLKSTGNILGVADVLVTPGDGPMTYSPVDDTANDIAIDNPQETDEVDNVSISFGQVTLNAYGYHTGVFPISRQLIRTATWDVLGFMRSAITARFGRGINRLCTTADGSNKPLGLVHALDVTVAGGHSAEITLQNLQDLIDSVDPAYHPNASLMMTRRTYSYLNRTLVTGTTGYPLFRRDFATNGPVTFDGFPIVINPYLDDFDHGAGSIPLIFGDFKKAFVIRLVGNLSIQTSTEQYWKSQALAVAGWWSFDSSVLDVNAAGMFQTAIS